MRIRPQRPISPARRAFAWPILMALVSLTASRARAQEIIRDVDDPPVESEPELFHLPYGFYSETWGLALGYGVVATGQVQEQLSLFATASASTNGTGQLILGGWGGHIPGTERLFVDGFLSLGHFSEQRAYIGEDASGVASGSNDSDSENFVQDAADEVWLEAPIRFVLPIGPGDEEPIQTYYLDRGILASEGTGGEIWNPLKSGRTYIGLRPFYRRQEFDLAPEDGQLATNGLSLGLWHNNTDFPRNPSKGSFQGVQVWRDFGALDSTNSWTSIEGQAAKYFDLGNTDWTRQQVLALGLWTATSPTWDEQETAEGTRISNAPPYYMGATLGGLQRLRAYPRYRFNDRAGIHYWAEYRMIPGYQPLPEVEEIRWADVDWWQVALFAEAGRVAPNWTFDTLHGDMKWDVGLSLRLFARKALVRIDFAVGPEGFAALIDLSQPF